MRPRRNAVEIRSTVGKVENSSGLPIDRVSIMMNTENRIEIANPISNSNVGIGISMNVRIVTSPSARTVSPRISPPKADFAVVAPPGPAEGMGDGTAIY